MGACPPIELYKVGQVYFVRDGNHRVSVARQHDAPTIQAYVWEYETRVPLEPDTEVKDLWSKAARADFLERTNLDRVCPDLQVELSHPDGYEDLLHEILVFQQSLSRIDDREMSLDGAVALWVGRNALHAHCRTHPSAGHPPRVPWPHRSRLVPCGPLATRRCRPAGRPHLVRHARSGRHARH